MSDLPPFEPPYHPLTPDFRAAIEAFEKGARVTVSDAPSLSTKVAGPAAGAKKDVQFLVVPFAEKDEAKALGARWDAASRKWYVPSGKDAAAFARWLAKA